MNEAGKPELSELRLSADEKTRGRNGAPFARLGPVLILLAAAGAGTAMFLALRGRETSRGAAQVQPVSPSEGTPAARRPEAQQDEVAAGGYVEARRTALVLPGREGIVAKVLVAQGQAVQKGELMMELDTRIVADEENMAAAELSRARAQLDVVKAGPRSEEIAEADADADAAQGLWEQKDREARRLDELRRNQLIAEAEVERARADAANALAVLKSRQARRQLMRRGSREDDIRASEAEVQRLEAAWRLAVSRRDLSSLRAPFTGVVVHADLEPGEVVSYMSGQGRPRGIELADTSELRVKVDIPETRIGAIRLGASVEIEVDALGPTRLAGTVVAIAPVAVRQSNTVECVVRIERPPPLLRPEMSARVRIRVRGDQEAR